LPNCIDFVGMIVFFIIVKKILKGKTKYLVWINLSNFNHNIVVNCQHYFVVPIPIQLKCKFESIFITTDCQCGWSYDRINTLMR